MEMARRTAAWARRHRVLAGVVLVVLPVLTLVVLGLGVRAALLSFEAESLFGSPEARNCMQAAPPVHGGPLAPPTSAEVNTNTAQARLDNGRALNGEAPVAETRPRGWRLALKYEPILKVAKQDRFWPVPLPTIFAHKQGQTATQIVRPHAKPPVETRADAGLADLRSPATPDDYLDYPAPWQEVQQQFCTVGRALDIPAAALADWEANPDALDPYRSVEIYYYRTLLPNNLISLQYWFFYPYNYFPLDVLKGFPQDPAKSVRVAVDFHEGDWEHVAVLFKRKGGHPTAVSFVMARHGTDETASFGWDQGQFKLHRDHPVVYAGFGSHASYASCPPPPRIQHRPRDSIPCGPGNLFTFTPNRTPLVDLRSVGWGCWPGFFGQLPRVLEKLKGKLREDVGYVAGGPPVAPLRQGENKQPPRQCG